MTSFVFLGSQVSVSVSDHDHDHDHDGGDDDHDHDHNHDDFRLVLKSFGGSPAFTFEAF